MASNNVVTDWNNVKTTAESQLAPIQSQIAALEKQAAPLRAAYQEAQEALTAQTNFYKQLLAKFAPNPPYVDILDLRDAYEKDPSNSGKKAAWEAALAKFNAQKAKLEQETGNYPAIIAAAQATYQDRLAKYNAVWQQLPPLYDKQKQLIDQIYKAEDQIALQKRGTAPGTSNVNSATTVPASSDPGNPNIATTTNNTTKTTSAPETLSGTSIAGLTKKPGETDAQFEARKQATIQALNTNKPVIIAQTPAATGTGSGGIAEALKTAPVGTDWYLPGLKGNGANIPAIHLRKNADGTFSAYKTGQAATKLSAAEAEKFFRTNGLTECNNPAYMPKQTVTTPTPKQPVTETKGAPPPAGTAATADRGAGLDYTVKKGDTLSAIAKKYGTTVEAILKANPQIKNANLIKVGEVIRIPGKEEETPDPGFDNSDILLAESIQTGFDQADFEAFEDWRVRLSLAPGADYLYAGNNPGILQPLIETNGVVFPYTPNIVVNYAANYNPIDLVHSNYKVQQYTNSSVDQVTLTCDFTAQDAFEARYVLAVIHFFRTMTKMFYGQDQYPIRGTPPPLCYLYGLGGYQFSAHPLVINSFNYNLPSDVDYIQTTTPSDFEGGATDGQWLDYIMNKQVDNETQNRLGDQCSVGAGPPVPKFTNIQKDITTYVPTKINISVTCLPVMSRNQVSNYFSLNDYASGYLIKGTSRPGGGMW